MCPPAIIPAVIAVGTMAAATAASVASNKKIAQQQAQASQAQTKAQVEAIKTVNSANKNVRNAVERTATQLKDNQTTKRTISSLRIPLKNNSNSTTGINTGDASQTGLNIPM